MTLGCYLIADPLAGRLRAIADIEAEPLADCHRDFLRGLRVRANLLVPVLVADNL
jgi:GAF domain-containing protein